MALRSRRQRKVNSKYVSDDFESIFTERGRQVRARPHTVQMVRLLLKLLCVVFLFAGAAEVTDCRRVVCRAVVLSGCGLKCPVLVLFLL